MLDQLLALSPVEFEHAVARLLSHLGFSNVRRTGGAGDLGVDIVCYDEHGGLMAVQCKRYAVGNNVTSPDIQQFFGMLVHHGARQGIYVTTSSFTKGAFDLAAARDIWAVAGTELASLFATYPEASEVVEPSPASVESWGVLGPVNVSPLEGNLPCPPAYAGVNFPDDRVLHEHLPALADTAHAALRLEPERFADYVAESRATERWGGFGEPFVWFEEVVKVGDAEGVGGDYLLRFNDPTNPALAVLTVEKIDLDDVVRRDSVDRLKELVSVHGAAGGFFSTSAHYYEPDAARLFHGWWFPPQDFLIWDNLVNIERRMWHPDHRTWLSALLAAQEQGLPSPPPPSRVKRPLWKRLVDPGGRVAWTRPLMR